ncbi:hypothetical protein DNI29_11800 [Hymenobacter sediminis]|uniref:hypothetical protein n=1 Tax=Hymenobacter sediminis TaxID=2218621 RepID=UPI000F500A57|nr:hypothetical protein [Hymenobacter sediminis]RPD46838.1 hypothetical protein DNI29_11800 [Hymenobacter sediminis]
MSTNSMGIYGATHDPPRAGYRAKDAGSTTARRTRYKNPYFAGCPVNNRPRFLLASRSKRPYRNSSSNY